MISDQCEKLREKIGTSAALRNISTGETRTIVPVSLNEETITDASGENFSLTEWMVL